MPNHHFATPTKLKSGEWGARIPGYEAAPKCGDELTIQARSGKTWAATVAAVVWTGGGNAIVATASAPRGRKYDRTWSHRQRHHDKARGLCTDCGLKPAFPGGNGLCHDCV